MHLVELHHNNISQSIEMQVYIIVTVQGCLLVIIRIVSNIKFKMNIDTIYFYYIQSYF